MPWPGFQSGSAMTEPLFSITIKPRASETDLVGHINNTSIAVWFEDLRVRFFEYLRDKHDLPMLKVTVASITIDYLAETFFGADVVANMRAVDVGNTSMTMHCDMYQGGKQVVRASAVLVRWDPETRRPQRIDDAYRAVLTP